MGYGIYDTAKGMAGYSVPDTCAEDGCDEKIDRGLAYLCGEDPHGTEGACGWWFCAEHLFYSDEGQRCRACLKELENGEDAELGRSTVEGGSVGTETST